MATGEGFVAPDASAAASWPGEAREALGWRGARGPPEGAATATAATTMRDDDCAAAAAAAAAADALGVVLVPLRKEPRPKLPVPTPTLLPPGAVFSDEAAEEEDEALRSDDVRAMRTEEELRAWVTSLPHVEAAEALRTGRAGGACERKEVEVDGRRWEGGWEG